MVSSLLDLSLMDLWKNKCFLKNKASDISATTPHILKERFSFMGKVSFPLAVL
jgi:hypothetical protein